MANRISLILEQSDYSTLIDIAVNELRTPEAQALHILLTNLRQDTDLVIREKLREKAQNREPRDMDKRSD